MPQTFTRIPVRLAPTGLVATLIQRPDGGPTRPIATGRRHKPVGAYYSIKNGGSLPWESRNELHGFYHAEVDASVIRYRAQPHTLETITGGRIRLYTPDRQDWLADGRVEVIEVKDTFEEQRDPEYALKLSLARSVYASLGWGFSVVDRRELEASPRFAAVEQIQAYRRTAVTTNDILALRPILAGSYRRPLGEVKAVFGNAALGMAKVFAMAVRRVVQLDLSSDLGDETPVWLVEEGGARPCDA